MKREEMNRIMKEEMSHISSTGRWQALFRMTYNMIRRHDLAQSPVPNRQDSFLSCLEDMKKTFRDFDAINLNYDTDFFIVVLLDSRKQLEPVKRDRLLLIDERQKVLRGWEIFAETNNLMLAWYYNDLIFRAGLVVEHKGACPTFSKERLVCPCLESIRECKEKGECTDVIFLSQARKRELEEMNVKQ